MSSSSYYQRNKERLREEFRRRYNADPEFRKAHIAKVAAYKKKKAAERKRLRSEFNMQRKIWRTFNVGGVPTPCCRVGFLAVSIKRSAQTLRLWERSGFLPKPIRYKKHRYYMKQHYDLVVQMWSRYCSVDDKPDLAKFFAEVRSKWNTVMRKP